MDKSVNGSYETHIQKLQAELERHRDDMERVERAIQAQTAGLESVGNRITAALDRHSDKIQLLVDNASNMIPRSVLENNIDKRTVLLMFTIMLVALIGVAAIELFLGHPLAGGK